MDFRDEKKEALINIAMVYLSGVRDYLLSPRGYGNNGNVCEPDIEISG